MSTLLVDINRDKQNNILYVLRKNVNPNKTRNLEMNEDVVFRIDSQTGDIAGLIIENFSENFSKFKNLSDYELSEKFDLFLEMLNDAHLQSKWLSAS